MSGLENLRSLVHEHYLPALERCSVILSRLKGLAQFYDDRSDIGFTVTQINRVLDIIDCLSYISNLVLSAVMDELDHFSSFSTWLRFEIDRLASSTASMREELDEKEATIDHGKVLTYIETYLVESPLRIFFDAVDEADWDAGLAKVEEGASSLLDELETQVSRSEAGQPHMKALPHVDFLVDYMASCSNRIFKGIAEAKKRSVRFGSPVKLSVGSPISKMDVRMCKMKNNVGPPSDLLGALLIRFRAQKW